MTSPKYPDSPDDSNSKKLAIPSEELLQGGRSVEIIHAGVRYRLLVTKNDKLILQK